MHIPSNRAHECPLKLASEVHAILKKKQKTQYWYLVLPEWWPESSLDLLPSKTIKLVKILRKQSFVVYEKCPRGI